MIEKKKCVLEVWNVMRMRILVRHWLFKPNTFQFKCNASNCMYWIFYIGPFLRQWFCIMNPTTSIFWRSSICILLSIVIPIYMYVQEVQRLHMHVLKLQLELQMAMDNVKYAEQRAEFAERKASLAEERAKRAEESFRLSWHMTNQWSGSRVLNS